MENKNQNETVPNEQPKRAELQQHGRVIDLKYVREAADSMAKSGSDVSLQDLINLIKSKPINNSEQPEGNSAD